MKKIYSLEIKLIISFWVALILALVGPFFYFTNTLKNEIQQETVKNVQDRMSILVWSLTRADFHSIAELDRAIKTMVQDSRDRISVISLDGEVLADSDVPSDQLSKLEDHSSREEVVQALNQDGGQGIRYSTTVDRHLIYYARRTHIQPAGDIILRMATPHAAMDSFVDRLSNGLWQIVLISLFFSTILVFFLVRRLTGKLQPMINVAQDIGRGNYQRRIPSSPGREFDPLVQAINEMAENIQNNIEVVSSQKMELETILNGVRDGLAALDNNCRIVSFNQAFKKTFSHFNNSLLGRRPLEVFHSNELQDNCREVVSNSQVRNRSLEINIRDRFYDINIVAPEDRKRIGAIVVFHDITSIRRLESVRKDFVANASHELRTPLTSIKGYTETLLDNPGILKEKGKDFLEVIVKNTNNMIRLLDDILQLSKIESQPDKMAVTNTALLPVVEKAWKECTYYAQGKSIDFSVELDDPCTRVMGESEALGHVFRNLFENSIKFVPDPGEIKVICRLNQDMVQVGVMDNGPGIPRDDQNRVFERFYRVKKTKNQVKGTGLGLAICRNIIRNMDGSIWVESPVPGQYKGCIIWFALKKAEGRK